MADVFISYSSKDKDAADYITSALKRSGVDVFIDRERLQGGEDWIERLATEIEKCKFVVLLESNDSAKSKWVKREIEYADKNEKLIIPVVLEPTTSKTFGFIFHSVQRIDFQRWNVDGNVSEAIAEIIGAILPNNSSNPVALQQPITPKVNRLRTPFKLIQRGNYVFIALIIIVVIVGGIFAFVTLRPSTASDMVDVGVLFLVDTSNEMKQPFHGVTPMTIARQAMEGFLEAHIEHSSKVWTGLREAGGYCDNTKLITYGVNLLKQQLIDKFDSINVGGDKAYYVGSEEAFKDLAITADLKSNALKSVILFLGSAPTFDSSPNCSNIDINRLVNRYNIPAKICIFTFLEDAAQINEILDQSKKQNFCYDNTPISQSISNSIHNFVQSSVNMELGLTSDFNILIKPTAIPIPKSTLAPTDRPTPTQTSTPTQPSPTATLQPTENGVTGDPVKGKDYFNTVRSEVNFACSTCHHSDSETQLIGPGLLNISSRAASLVPGQSAYDYILASIVDPSKYVVPEYPDGLMPKTYKDIWTDSEIKDIIAYLYTLKS